MSRPRLRRAGRSKLQALAARPPAPEADPGPHRREESRLPSYQDLAAEIDRRLNAGTAVEHSRESLRALHEAGVALVGVMSAEASPRGARVGSLDGPEAPFVRRLHRIAKGLARHLAPSEESVAAIDALGPALPSVAALLTYLASTLLEVDLARRRIFGAPSLDGEARSDVEEQLLFELGFTDSQIAARRRQRHGSPTKVANARRYVSARRARWAPPSQWRNMLLELRTIAAAVASAADLDEHHRRFAEALRCDLQDPLRARILAVIACRMTHAARPRLRKRPGGGTTPPPGDDDEAHDA
jgi:hypothetical protein